MLKISRTTLSDEEELRQSHYDNPIQMCDKSIESIVKHLRVLKHVLLINSKTSKMKSISLKNIKPNSGSLLQK
jgi:hypothetical protein